MKNPLKLLTHIPGLLTLLLLAVMGLTSCGGYTIESKIQRADSYIEVGNYDKALEEALEAKSCLTDKTPIEERIEVYSLLGQIYYNTYKREQAQPYLKASLELTRQSSKPGELATKLWNYVLTISDIDSVEKVLSECRDLSRRDSIPELENRTKLYLVKVAILRGNYPEARIMLDSIQHSLGDKANLDIDFVIMRSLLLSRTGQPDEAIKILQQWKNEDLSLDGNTNRYELLSKFSRQLGDYNMAIEYRDSLDSYMDSIHALEVSESAAKIEKELTKRLHHEQQIRQTIVWVGISITVLMLLAILILHRNRRQKAYQLKLVKEIAALNVKLTELAVRSEADSDGNEDSAGSDTTDEKERSIMEKFRLNLEFFKTLPAYSELQRLTLERNADDIDRTLLRNAVDSIIGQFADSCTSLRQFFPALTADDGLYCISYSGLSKECISAFLAASDDALRRRKSRIKQKMSASMFAFLFK